jgi:hypothetical protein
MDSRMILPERQCDRLGSNFGRALNDLYKESNSKIVRD